MSSSTTIASTSESNVVETFVSPDVPILKEKKDKKPRMLQKQLKLQVFGFHFIHLLIQQLNFEDSHELDRIKYIAYDILKINHNNVSFDSIKSLDFYNHFLDNYKIEFAKFITFHSPTKNKKPKKTITLQDTLQEPDLHNDFDDNDDQDSDLDQELENQDNDDLELEIEPNIIAPIVVNPVVTPVVNSPVIVVKDKIKKNKK
jgi:hypothetical protein